MRKENAEARYLARGRDRNDSAEKFTKRYAEYLNEGPPVERHYRDAGLLVEVSLLLFAPLPVIVTVGFETEEPV